MRIYFKGLGSGELPALTVDKHRAFTLENGKVRSARKYDNDQRVYAYEKWYVEHQTNPGVNGQWAFSCNYHDHPIDVIQQVDHWDYTLENLRPGIREPLIADARLLNMSVVIALIRTYRCQWGGVAHENFHTVMAAGLIGLDVDILSWYGKGPYWPSVFERNLDALIEGETIPEGMTLYGITPRGKIINPLPPLCEKCEMRHYRQHNNKCPTKRDIFMEWASEHSP